MIAVQTREDTRKEWSRQEAKWRKRVKRKPETEEEERKTDGENIFLA